MPLESVIDDLMAQARASAEAKLAEAGRLRDETLARAESEALSIAELYKNKLRTESEGLHRTSAREADIEVRRLRQAMIKGVFDRTYAELLARLTEQTERGKYVAGFAEKVARELGSGRIHVKAGDEMLLTGRMRLKVLGDLTGATGVLGESDDRSVVLDLTTETLLQDFWQQNLSLVRSLLFG